MKPEILGAGSKYKLEAVQITPAGKTESKEAYEICAQGSSRVALASQHGIDRGLQCYFENSTDEASYGSVKVQPQPNQDDRAKVVICPSSARAGNEKLSSLLRERLLSCHPTKKCYIFFRTEKYRKEVEKSWKESSNVRGLQDAGKRGVPVPGRHAVLQGVGRICRGNTRPQFDQGEGSNVQGGSHTGRPMNTGHGRDGRSMGMANCGSWVGITKKAIETLSLLYSQASTEGGGRLAHNKAQHNAREGLLGDEGCII